MKEWYSYSGILLLAEVLKGLALKPLDNATIHSLIGFFADRLVSWFSVAQISHLSPCFSWVCFGFNSVLLLFVVELLSLSSLPCLIYGENISLIRIYSERFCLVFGWCSPPEVKLWELVDHICLLRRKLSSWGLKF